MPIRQITQDELDELFGDGLILIGQNKPITAKENVGNNLAEKNITPQNELLGVESAKLDSGTTPTTEGVNSTLEAVDKVNRG